MKMGQFIGESRSVLEKGRRVEEAFLKSLEEASVSSLDFEGETWLDST